MTQGFNDNLYLIDLSYLNTPAEIVYDLSSILDTEPAKNQRIKLKLGKVDFNKSQLLSIKSLIESINSTLATVDGKSEITRASAISAGLVFQNSADMVPETILSKAAQEPAVNIGYETVKPELFPDVSPVREEQTEENNQAEQTSETEEKPTEDNSYEELPESSNSIEIKPMEFETSEENLNFEDKNDIIQIENKEEIQTEQTEVQTETSENTENQPVENTEDNNSSENAAQNIENSESVENSENVENAENTENSSENTEENSEEKADENNTDGNSDEQAAIGIQTLADIPLDIPTDKEIQDELSVIYNTERKLEDIFENTGLNEEKFKSLKDAPQAEEREYTQYDFEIEAFPTKYLKQTICAGQFISFEGNLVIIGDCHEGSEITATGDITVWGELSGSAFAGKNGNEKCRIRALKMNASQLRISNCFVKRPSVLNKPNQKYEPVVPEEARISKGEIVVYKIYK